MFHVSCLGIRWCHDIWIFEKLKFDYLKNEKRFRSEVKKQTSENKEDTTLKDNCPSLEMWKESKTFSLIKGVLRTMSVI